MQERGFARTHILAMGAQASSAVQEMTSEISTTVESSCPKTNCSNKLEAASFNVSGTGNTGRIKQACTASSDCIMNAALSAATDQVAKASAEAKAGLGISATSTYQQIKTKLSNAIKQDCGSTAAENEMKLGEINISGSDNLGEILQVGDAKSKCQLGALTDTISKMSGEGDSKASGFDPTIIIIAIIVLLALGGGVYLFVMRDKFML